MWGTSLFVPENVKGALAGDGRTEVRRVGMQSLPAGNPVGSGTGTGWRDI